jgi:hypothetical protein
MPAPPEPPGEPEAPDVARFLGGPWDGDLGRYYGLHAYPTDATPGGRYVFHEVADDGAVVYVFEHGPRVEDL